MVYSDNTDGIEISKSFTIINKLGVHVRPATQLVKTANKFDSDIFIKKDDLEVDGKSIMGILMLAASNRISLEGHWTRAVKPRSTKRSVVSRARIPSS